MRFRAIHKKPDGSEETVIIISILRDEPGTYASAIYVREDGSVGEDEVNKFVITEGAWR